MLTVGQVVVDRVILCGQFVEEHLREVGNAFIFVLNALGHLTHLALDLDHTVENQMSENHERVLLYDEVVVAETLVELVVALVDDAAE